MGGMSASDLQPTTIALIRHGQTDWNADGKFQGSSDTLLNERGRAQAAEAADWLASGAAGTRWDAVRYSPLKRAAETGAIVAQRLSVPLGSPLPALVERDWGVGEELISEEIFDRWPEVFTPDNVHIGRNLIPGVEPFDLMVARGRFALSTLALQYPAGNVIATSHGTVIKFTLLSVLDQPLGYVPNGGVVVMRCRVECGDLRVELVDTSFDQALPEPYGKWPAGLTHWTPRTQLT